MNEQSKNLGMIAVKLEVPSWAPQELTGLLIPAGNRIGLIFLSRLIDRALAAEGLTGSVECDGCELNRCCLYIRGFADAGGVVAVVLKELERHSELFSLRIFQFDTDSAKWPAVYPEGCEDHFEPMGFTEEALISLHQSAAKFQTLTGEVVPLPAINHVLPRITELRADMKRLSDELE